MNTKRSASLITYALPPAMSGGKPVTTMAVGEEGAGKPEKPVTTMAVGEETGSK